MKFVLLRPAGGGESLIPVSRIRSITASDAGVLVYFTEGNPAIEIPGTTLRQAQIALNGDQPIAIIGAP